MGNASGGGGQHQSSGGGGGQGGQGGVHPHYGGVIGRRADGNRRNEAQNRSIF
jgi:hypothetical protein